MKSLQEQFRDEIEAFLSASQMNATEFGKRAVKDPNFVFQVREGRSCGVKLIDRVRGFMSANAPAAPEHDKAA